ncbi:ATP-dependent DNA helicase PcrA [compost metagenome]
MSKEEEFVPDYEDTEENPFEGIESFFDEVATGQGVVSAPTVIKSNNNASVDILYDKLKGMNYNLEELKEVMECKNTMLVKSIAGSGKSTAMILTIIRGLLSGEYLKTKRIKTAMGESEIVIPVNILVSTFLKSGAESLKKDFKMWVKKLGITGIDVDAIHFKTIHAEAYHALKDMGVNVSILENTDALIREIMKEFSIRSNLVKSRNITLEEVKDMGSIISYARNMLDPAKKYNHSLMVEYNLNPILLDAVLRSFAIKRRQSGKLDFEDMQESLLNAAKTNPNVAEFLGTRYDYIFVDEFQDTSDLQYELLKYYFKGAKRVVAIGDDDQCLIEGTEVKTPYGYKKIEDVKMWDKLTVGIGYGETVDLSVDNVSKKLVKEEIITIKTKLGKVLKGTKGHIAFAKVVPCENTYYVYLMHRGDIGFRIGMTSGVRAGHRKELTNGISIRLNQEKGDKAWLLCKCDTLEEARYWESFYSYSYGIPQYVFVDPKGKNSIAFDLENIRKLHKELDTLNKGYKLLEDLELNNEYPHFQPQASGNRVSIGLNMFTSKGNKTREGVHKTELCANTSNVCYEEVLREHLPVSTKKVKESDNYYANGRRTSSDIDGLTKTLKNIVAASKDKGLDIRINKTAKLTDESYSFTPFSNLLVGMHTPVLVDGVIVDDEIVSVTKEMYEGYVYDVSVPEARNFIANDIVVHNCIYSFRGSDIDIILHKFEEDCKPDIKQLTTNYRCKENILNAVAPSITKNKFRLEKELRAAKPGGEVVVALNKDVNYLVDQILNSLGQNHTVGVLARTNAELLIPAILLELDGKINFSLSKSINLNNKLTKTIIGVMDLVTKRYTEDFGTYLKMFIPKYDGFQADKLADSLKINRGFNLFNIPDRDIKHSVPALAPFLHGLREAKKIDDVSAYLFILEYMKSYVFTSNSTYAKNSRDFITFMMGLILEHKDIKEYSLGELNELFTSTLPERFHRRVQYSGESLVKLSTVHEAKGKEWDTVIMWNVVVGSYPNEVGNKVLTQFEIEEERRVFYIAWSRAKNKLIVFSYSGRQSMFLQECNLENATHEDSSQISSIRLKNKGKVEEELSIKDKLVNALNAYKEDVYNSNKSLTSVVLANLEIIDAALNSYSLADKLISEYGVGLDGKVHLTSDELDAYMNDIANKLIDGE